MYFLDKQNISIWLLLRQYVIYVDYHHSTGELSDANLVYCQYLHLIGFLPNNANLYLRTLRTIPSDATILKHLLFW